MAALVVLCLVGITLNLILTGGLVLVLIEVLERPESKETR